MKTAPTHNARVDFDTVLEFGGLLPEVRASRSSQGVALRLKGRLVACTAINRSAEPGSLMVCLDFPVRDALLEKQPDTFYITPHYRGYPAVLVRLAKIRRSTLRHLLEQAALFVAAQNTTARTRPQASPRSRRG